MAFPPSVPRPFGAFCMMPVSPGSAIRAGVPPEQRCASVKQDRWWSAILTPRQKNLIERAYRLGEAVGVDVWCEDEAGPYQTIPIPGQSWTPAGQPGRQAHEYVRNGTAKLLTLFHPRDGQVRVKGVTSCTNAVLLPWLKQQLTAILATLPLPAECIPTADQRPIWEQWQQGLTV